MPKRQQEFFPQYNENFYVMLLFVTCEKIKLLLNSFLCQFFVFYSLYFKSCQFLTAPCIELYKSTTN